MKLAGEYRGDPWGAVILAQWEIREGGSIVRLLIPPAAIQAIRSPKTFAKIEMTAAYRLKGHARRLYAALADKKRLGKSYWTYEIAELYAVFDTHGQYKKWYDLRRYVLDPAIAEINDYGTVKVKKTPQKTGRSVTAVRFDWEWKTLDEARETEEENEQPKGARHMDRKQNDAPPLTDEERRKILRDEHFNAWRVKNPGLSYAEFVQAPEYKQLRAALGYER
jgi:plasmid replication initiation protein